MVLNWSTICILQFILPKWSVEKITGLLLCILLIILLPCFVLFTNSTQAVLHWSGAPWSVDLFFTTFLFYWLAELQNSKGFSLDIWGNIFWKGIVSDHSLMTKVILKSSSNLIKILNIHLMFLLQFRCNNLLFFIINKISILIMIFIML